MSAAADASSPAVARVVARAKNDPDALAVMLFGSRARGEAGPGSDFDVCLVLANGPTSDAARTQKRLDYLAQADVDLAIFQQLPLHVRSRVLKEGRVLFVRDEDALYDVAIRTAKAWEDFRHIHRMYLDAVAHVVDRERVLSRLDALDGVLRELRSIAPKNLDAYLATEKKRACERLVQLAVEALIDACALLVTGLRLGLPGDEDDLFERLARSGALAPATGQTLRRMKGLRNLLVHEYGRISDQIVFETIRDRLGDFDACKREILDFLQRG